MRPFFLTSDGSHPTQYKRYYDILSWLVTQAAFSFTVAPFILLTFSDSFAAWSRVYFYCIIGATASLGFFASPAQGWLKGRLDRRNTPYLRKTISQESVRGPTMGLPEDPSQDLDEIIEEVKREIETRKKTSRSIGQDLRETVQERLK